MWPAPRCQDYSRNKGGKGEKGGYNFNRVIKEVFVGKVTLSKDPRRGAASPVAFIRLGEQGSERRDEQAQSPGGREPRGARCRWGLKAKRQGQATEGWEPSRGGWVSL